LRWRLGRRRNRRTWRRRGVNRTRPCLRRDHATLLHNRLLRCRLWWCGRSCCFATGSLCRCRFRCARRWNCAGWRRDHNFRWRRRYHHGRRLTLRRRRNHHHSRRLRWLRGCRSRRHRHNRRGLSRCGHNHGTPGCWCCGLGRGWFLGCGRCGCHGLVCRPGWSGRRRLYPGGRFLRSSRRMLLFLLTLAEQLHHITGLRYL
jgi:hypothetical protein